MCFGQFLHPSSGVFHCTHSNGICHTGLLTAGEQAVSKPVWHMPLLCVQWKTPDDGQRNCPKHIVLLEESITMHSHLNIKWRNCVGSTRQIFVQYKADICTVQDRYFYKSVTWITALDSMVLHSEDTSRKHSPVRHQCRMSIGWFVPVASKYQRTLMSALIHRLHCFGRSQCNVGL